MRTLTLLMIASLVPLGLPTPGLAQEEDPDPHGLRGIDQIDVDFGVLELAGAARASGLRTRIERRLANAGFELEETEGIPRLDLSINLRVIDDTLVTGTLTLSLKQETLMARDQRVTALAETWRSTSLIFSVMNEEQVEVLIRRTIDSKTSDFLRDHRRANRRWRSPAREESFLQRLWPF